MEITLRTFVFASPEYEQELVLRTAILRTPLGLKFSAADLMQDETQIHVGAFAGDRLVGCLLLAPQPDRRVKMRQVAVAGLAQGRGVGRKLVVFAEKLAVAQGFHTMVLHSRMEAAPFYERLGYLVDGKPFVEVTLPHLKMWKDLVAN